MYFELTKDFQEAEKWAQESVSMFMELCKTSQDRRILENVFKSIINLQSLHVCQGHPELSEKIFEEIVVPNFSQGFENVEFFTYVVKLASGYASHDYPEFVNSKCQVILDMYGEHAESLDLSLEHHSVVDGGILGLVASARSLLGHQLLNEGKVQEFMDHFSRFEKEKRAFQV